MTAPKQPKQPEQQPEQPDFELEALRWLVGLVAILLPVVVFFLYLFIPPLPPLSSCPAASCPPPQSISASYYHDIARNIFVGALFMIGAFLFAYRGHINKKCRIPKFEDWVANLGACAAIIAALCPTSPDGTRTLISVVHLGGGAILFAVTAYFCLGPFRQCAEERAKQMVDSDRSDEKARRRIWVYIGCGILISACILVAFLDTCCVFDGIKGTWPLIFWVETFALLAFGFAWMVASKIFPWFADDDERFIWGPWAFGESGSAGGKGESGSAGGGGRNKKP